MVTITNLSKNTIISNSAKEAVSLCDLTFGLLNPKNPRFMVFRTRFGIHTLFMKNPIDVLILDKNGTVKKINENLVPFRLYLYNPKLTTVIELPPGVVNKSNIGINDKISIK